MRDYRFGNYLHEMRKKHGLTQFQLGALVGVSDKAVSKWENGITKPQSRILHKLSEILNISADELLSCQESHDKARLNETNIFSRKKRMWERAYQAMIRRYGEHPPFALSYRFLMEKNEIEVSDEIVYYNFLSVLNRMARLKGKYLANCTEAGGSFVAYLLGATDINPLKPHYYCPACHCVVFDETEYDGWDLPEKRCSCGDVFLTDGHNIPFETLHRTRKRNLPFYIKVSSDFLETARSVIHNYFHHAKIAVRNVNTYGVYEYTVSSEKEKRRLILRVDKNPSRHWLLGKKGDVCLRDVLVSKEELLSEFQKGNTIHIPEFEYPFLRNMMAKAKPSTFHELMKIAGLSHGTGVWTNNAENLLKQGIALDRIVAYREDIFNYIHDKASECGLSVDGLALQVMEDVRCGRYANSEQGIPNEIKEMLREVRAEEWFITFIKKMSYLFPKINGVEMVRNAATLMWYRINDPTKFNEIISSNT